MKLHCASITQSITEARTRVATICQMVHPDTYSIQKVTAPKTIIAITEKALCAAPATGTVLGWIVTWRGGADFPGGAGGLLVEFGGVGGLEQGHCVVLLLGFSFLVYEDVAGGHGVEVVEGGHVVDTGCCFVELLVVGHLVEVVVVGQPVVVDFFSEVLLVVGHGVEVLLQGHSVEVLAGHLVDVVSEEVSSQGHSVEVLAGHLVDVVSEEVSSQGHLMEVLVGHLVDVVSREVSSQGHSVGSAHGQGLGFSCSQGQCCGPGCSIYRQWPQPSCHQCRHSSQGLRCLPGTHWWWG